MPIYEYQCTKCHAHYEVFQKINARPLRKCEKCGGRLDKLISQSSFQLKGTGWYVTDYARKGSSGDSKKNKETKSDNSKKKD